MNALWINDINYCFLTSLNCWVKHLVGLCDNINVFLNTCPVDGVLQSVSSVDLHHLTLSPASLHVHVSSFCDFIVSPLSHTESKAREGEENGQDMRL